MAHFKTFNKLCNFTYFVWRSNSWYHALLWSSLPSFRFASRKCNSCMYVSCPHKRGTNPDICANSVDPDETAHDEPFHQNLPCLPFCFDFWVTSLFASMEMSKFSDWRADFTSIIIIFCFQKVSELFSFSNCMYAYATHDNISIKIHWPCLINPIIFRVLIHSELSNLPLTCTQIIGATDYASWH